MKREWNTEGLAEYWTLRPDEAALLANKSGATRLGFAALLKFFQYQHCFPRQQQEIPVVVIEYLAPQVEVLPTEWTQYDWKGRTIKYHRAQIRDFLGFREAPDMPGEVFDDGMRNLLALPGKAALMLEKLQQNCKAQASRAILIAEQVFLFRSQRPVLGKFIRVPLTLHSLTLQGR